MTAVIMIIQLFATVVMGIYFYRQLKAQERVAPRARESGREMEKLRLKRRIHLTEPLSETVRPAGLADIVGQQEGIRALQASLFGKNPQHVILYGPPGVGKTCAARLVMQAAKRSPGTPFLADAPFIEMDATCVRFDERAIADPLIGSVHDPIYQGAGQLGINGVPQPKEGAVSRAHGGVLFLDEIGELHPTQMNKLLKVLEDRLVRFESAYYNPDDTATPRYIHDIFQNGLPADFRLIGATTRRPEELPPALRSRCMEIFFRPLEAEEKSGIAQHAAARAGYALRASQGDLIGAYADNGREAVNIVEMCAGVASLDTRREISDEDIEWVLACGRYAPHMRPVCPAVAQVGLVHALAVTGGGEGIVFPIEAAACPGSGMLFVTGIVEEEELSVSSAQKLRRRSMARGAAENARMMLLRRGLLSRDTDLYLNFPGGVPVDGPSAGTAMAVAMASALSGRPVAADIVMTGEIALFGGVLPVGGVAAKLEAAEKAGFCRALIPRDNMQKRFREMRLQVTGIETIDEALAYAGLETHVLPEPAALPCAGV